MSGRGKGGRGLSKMFGKSEMFINNNTDQHVYVVIYNDPEELICTNYTSKLNTGIDIGSHGHHLNVNSEQVVNKSNRGGKSIIPIIKLLPKQQKRHIKIKGEPYVLYYIKEVKGDITNIQIIEIFKTEKQYTFDIDPEDLKECSIELDVKKDENLLDRIYKEL